jgi:hypothetical protein
MIVKGERKITPDSKLCFDVFLKFWEFDDPKVEKCEESEVNEEYWSEKFKDDEDS